MGYPQRLKGEEIDWNARVITLADAYDNMTTGRYYQKTFTNLEAVEEIKNNAGVQFDPDIAKVFVEKVLGFEW